MTRQKPERPKRRKGGIGAGPKFALLFLATIGVAAFTYVGYLMWPRWPHGAVTADAPSMPITVGGVVFNVPPAAIRLPVQRHPGAQPRLDLAFMWPELTPPDPAAKPAVTEDPKPPSQLFINIAAPQGTLPVGERIKTIYPRYIAQTAFDGPEGLLGVPFRDGTPYQGEDLFFPAERPESFVVRCTRVSGATDGTCLLERHVGEAEVTIRFPRDWLGEWQKLAESLDRLLTGLRTGRS